MAAITHTNQARAWPSLGLVLVLLVSSLGLAGCASAPTGPRSSSPALAPAPGSSTVGYASYYGSKYHGRKTASGETYNMYKLTAAHRTLPFGTSVRVTNLGNNRSVIVRVNDRGPFSRARLIDVSLEAARKLDLLAAGTARVSVEVLGASFSGPDETDERLTDLAAKTTRRTRSRRDESFSAFCVSCGDQGNARNEWAEPLFSTFNQP